MPEWLTVAEATRRYPVSDKTLRNWIKVGLVLAQKVMIGGHEQYAIDPREIERVIEERHIPERPGRPVSTGTDAETLARIEDLEHRVAVLESLLHAPGPSREVEESAPVYHTVRRYKTRPQQLHGGKSTLPPGYVSAEGFRHNVPGTSALRWMKEHGEVGDWRSPRGNKVALALSPEIQREYWLEFHGHDRFEECEQCPHDLS